MEEENLERDNQAVVCPYGSVSKSWHLFFFLPPTQRQNTSMGPLKGPDLTVPTCCLWSVFYAGSYW